MNETLNKEDSNSADKHKKLVIISLFISCVLLISFIIALIVITLNLNSYIKRVYDKSLQSVVEVKAYTKDVGESFGSAVLMKKRWDISYEFPRSHIFKTRRNKGI